MASQMAANDEMGWQKYAIKQGYLIKFEEDEKSAPKMQYFILTECGLISFENEPRHDTNPLIFLPYEQLSSVRLEQIEMNNAKLSCMNLTSKICAGFTLCFNRKKERDNWLMLMMTSFLECLATANVFPASGGARTSHQHVAKSAARAGDRLATTDFERSRTCGERSTMTKRRRGQKGSIRKSKLFESLDLEDGRICSTEFAIRDCDTRLQATLTCHNESLSNAPSGRKRKSEPNVNEISHENSNFEALFHGDDKRRDKKISFSSKDEDPTVNNDKQSDSKRKTSVLKKLRSRLERST